MADDTPQPPVIDKELIKTALSELLLDIPAFRAFATNPRESRGILKNKPIKTLWVST